MKLEDSPEKAYPLLIQAMKESDYRAHYAIGTWHLFGLHLKLDFKKAVKYLRCAAENDVAEAAFENMQSTQPVGQPTPFWRVIEPTAPIAKKLSFDPAFIQHMRDAESTANE